MITSASNSQVKNLTRLQNDAKARDGQGVFVIEGKKAFEELKVLDKSRIVKAYITDLAYDEVIKRDGRYLDGVPYDMVEERVFSRMTQVVAPQGILAVVRQVRYEVEDLIERVSNATESNVNGSSDDDSLNDNEAGTPGVNLLVLEDVQDPGNLGTIIRTAEGAGMSGVLLGKGCVDMYNPKVVRATMGSIFRVPFAYAKDLTDTVSFLKSEGFKVMGAHLAGSVDYRQADYGGRNAILLGNESNGLSDKLSELCDVKVRIPMRGNVESLNIAIAAALLMYEMSFKNL